VYTSEAATHAVGARIRGECAKVKAGKLAKIYRIDSGEHFRLKDFDPADTANWRSKDDAEQALQEGIARTAEMQDKLFAQNRWAVLLIFQAMDAAGKDGAIKHVMSGVNPQGCQVYSFKQPSELELQHDFLWRTTLHLPERGHIGIFNRSYYEEVLVVRVHRELLRREKLSAAVLTKKVWKERFQDIREFEDHMARSGTVIRKFFLNISKEEQKRRFLARLEEPEKNWKFSAADIRERAFWDQYQEAYEEMIRNTAAESAPWYVVPADHKWFTRLVVSAVIVDTLEELDLSYPKLDEPARKELSAAKKELLNEN
jgi:PPK2 family polyphosphate:nucleotide phosphotransferase